jgi:hypothetical protein
MNPGEGGVEFTLRAADAAHIDRLMQAATLSQLGRTHAPLERPPGPRRRIGQWALLTTLAEIHSQRLVGSINAFVRLCEFSWPGYGHMIRLEGAKRCVDGRVILDFFIESL